MENEPSEKISEHQINKRYKDAREKFDASIKRTKLISRGSAGRISAHPREYWASVLYTRLVVMGISILQLSPRTGPTADRNAHWDFSSAASLVRNLAECYFVFFYLCADKIDEDEFQTRLTLLQIRDNFGRLRMFREWDPNDEQLPGFLDLQNELQQKLRGQKYFASLPPKHQSELLRGDKDPMTQDEILERMGENRTMFRGIYRFFSAHTHSSPLSYYRMAEHGRGHGIENLLDKGYLATALELANGFMERASAEMLEIFPDAERASTNRPILQPRRRK